MSIFYLDYENGDDSNNGSSWANAWKTITSGATAARIAPGDVIRIAKSPAPTSIGNATWTNLSKTVTLASAQTQTIELCESAWTASANVTATTTTTCKEGSYASSLAIKSSFTTGKVAYKSFSELNLSSYQKLSFWLRTSATITENYLKVVLCSDTSGATIVDTFYIPGIVGTARYLPLTITKDGGGNLGASIQSIAVYANSDPRTPTLLLDDFIACTTDGLNLQSLISKNSNEQGGTEGWYGIQSINGTTVLLDENTNTSASSGRGYSGTTETVTTYKRETIKTALASSSTTQVQVVQDNGTDGSNIEFQGGWNTSTTEQDGETFFDGLNGLGYGLCLSSKSYITLNYLNFYRYASGLYLNSSSNNTIALNNACNNTNLGVYVYYLSNYNSFTTLSNLNNNAYGIQFAYAYNNSVDTIGSASNNSSWGIYFSQSHRNSISNINDVNNNNYEGVYFENSSNNSVGTITNANNNAGRGIGFSYSFGNLITEVTNANDNNVGVNFSFSADNTIKSLSTTGNSSGHGVIYDCGNNFLFNSLIDESSEAGYTINFSNSRVYSHLHDQTADNHKIFTDGGLISSNTSVRHTASGISWQLSPTSTDRSSNYPLDLSIAKIAVAANSQVTVKAWFRRTNTGITGRLICKGHQIAGVTSDVYSDMTAAADTWEELTITFTPTEVGVVEIQAQAWGGTTYSVYVDDMTISQA